MGQTFFAVAGHPQRTQSVFDAIKILTARSDPSSEILVHEGPSIRVGYDSRAFGSLELEGRPGLYLEGVVRSIDGVTVHPSERRRTLLERLAQSYRRHGRGVWKQLDGTFRLIIVDGDEAFAGTDISGTRSLYWWEADGVWACHSHLLDLAPAYPRQLDVDLAAVGAYCSYGAYPPNLTAFRQIGHLGAGQCLRVADERVVTEDHFSRAPLPARVGNDADAVVDELVERATQAISTSFAGATELALPLSGGVDSRLIAVAAAHESGRDVIRTITWGEQPDRPGSDAVIAAQIATTLGVENVWYPKTQEYEHPSFNEAIYLSSGEFDHAIHYPQDHLLNAELATVQGFRSLARGDNLYGNDAVHRLMTERGFRGYSGLYRLSVDTAYPELLGDEVFRSMAKEQEDLVETHVASARAESAYGKWMELRYAWYVRRGLAPYNVVKNADLEVLNPLLNRSLNEWFRTLPDELTVGKGLIRQVIQRLNPDVAAIPYAAASNLPSWPERWRRDPAAATFYIELCAGPGWLDEIGAASRVRSALERMRLVAEDSAPDASPDLSGDPQRLTRYRAALYETLRVSRPGRLFAELTLERRATGGQLSQYLRLSRLGVLHRLTGEVAKRRASLHIGSSR
jgi:asparagine synthetase B (glutamine-hydrolysing)